MKLCGPLPPFLVHKDPDPGLLCPTEGQTSKGVLLRACSCSTAPQPGRVLRVGPLVTPALKDIHEGSLEPKHPKIRGLAGPWRGKDSRLPAAPSATTPPAEKGD